MTILGLVSMGQACSSQEAVPILTVVKIDANDPIPTCKEARLPQGVERLIRPVLEARVERLAKDDEDTNERYDTAFYNLVESRDSEALEAQVALMAYYVGEHYGHELVDAVLEHGPPADVLVNRYKVCRPPVSFESQLSGVMVLRTLYGIYDSDRSPQSHDDG